MLLSLQSIRFHKEKENIIYYYLFIILLSSSLSNIIAVSRFVTIEHQEIMLLVLLCKDAEAVEIERKKSNTQLLEYITLHQLM